MRTIVQPRRRLIWAAAVASVAAAISIPALVGAFDGGSEDGAPPPDGGAPLPGNAEFAGSVVKVTTTQYLNYNAGGRETSPEWMRIINDRTSTESWSQIDGNGNIVAYRNVTRDENGKLVQDQHYDGQVEHVNRYSWLDTGQDCTTDTDIGKFVGGVIPVLSEDKLKSLDVSSATLPSEAAALARNASPVAFSRSVDHGRPGFVNDREVFVVDPSTNYLVGLLIYAVDANGAETLLESSLQVVERVDGNELPNIPWDALPTCSRAPQVD